MRAFVRAIRVILERSVRKFLRDDPVRLAGTTAYFVVFSIAPILVIITSALGILIDEQTVTTKLFQEISSLVGTEGATFLRALVENFEQSERNLIGTIVGISVFLFASTTFFSVLQRNLNFIWRVRANPRSGLLNMARNRLLSFGLILSLGFVLLVSLIIDAALAYLGDVLRRFINEYTFYLLEPANFIVSFGIVTLVFVLVYKVLPDARIRWSVTWVGALITAALFRIGKYVVGVTLAATNVSAAYGAAGSIVVLLVWVYYTSIILYFGAEITEQYARYFGVAIEPKPNAVQIEISEVHDHGEAATEGERGTRES